MLRYLLPVVLATAMNSASASSEYQAGWESVRFTTHSGYEISLTMNDQHLLERLEVKRQGKAIPIPASSYCKIAYPAFDKVSLTESLGGFARLEFPSTVFERSRAVGHVKWAFYFENGRFLGLQEDGVPHIQTHCRPD